MNLNVLISSMTLLAGLALLAAGTLTAVRRKEQLRRAIRTQGTVVELLPLRQAGKYVIVKTETGREIRPKYTYRAVIEFEPPQGRTVRFKASVSTQPPGFQVGDQVPVVYEPENPAGARIDQPLYLWFDVGMLVFFGLFCIGMGLLGRWLQP